MICPKGIEMDSATVHEEIDSLFESTPPLKDSAKIIDKLNQVIQFDSPSGEGKGRRVEELLKRCPNLKKIIIFRVISKAKPHKECQVYSSGSSQSAQFANSWKRIGHFARGPIQHKTRTQLTQTHFYQPKINKK
ncbi:uncharacterized protein [Gossypium hirsutum]|uniref:Uncharacterized protein isoform X5 n=1 Tax=Gossypium hirsutum TaxID=3635 RepID=A0ABM3BI34_GOSHI|nr:uncharacterized protein LOC107920369 isoform X5 [Gossypium hirsutum]